MNLDSLKKATQRTAHILIFSAQVCAFTFGKRLRQR